MNAPGHPARGNDRRRVPPRLCPESESNRLAPQSSFLVAVDAWLGVLRGAVCARKYLMSERNAVRDPTRGSQSCRVRSAVALQLDPSVEPTYEDAAATHRGGEMGSIVEFNCRSCGFTSGNLSVGWGKAG